MATASDDNLLLDQLGHGDEAAAGALFAVYAPYLRALVRGHVSERFRAKFGTSDVVQSVWVQVVRKIRDGAWRVASAAELRALLATIARRRAITRARHDGPAARLERPLGDASAGVAAAGQARPSEVAQADELWQRMLDRCPPEHRDVLQLRRDGCSPAEIAERTGLHPGSVRRILRRVARDVADGFPLRLDSEPTVGPAE